MSNVVYHASALIVRQSWTIERDMPLLGDKEQLSQEDLDSSVGCEILDPGSTMDSSIFCENSSACVAKRVPQHVRCDF